jgi:hypothetical protein
LSFFAQPTDQIVIPETLKQEMHHIDPQSLATFMIPAKRHEISTSHASLCSHFMPHDTFASSMIEAYNVQNKFCREKISRPALI